VVVVAVAAGTVAEKVATVVAETTDAEI